ncbi:hypothetical protein SANTM175S_10040 [Streptomyces antimycoticus]
MIDGTQAEYVRVPFADLSTYPLTGAAEGHDAVLLSDVFPTAYEVGVLNGQVGPGDTVVVVGAGPVGLGRCIVRPTDLGPRLGLALRRRRAGGPRGPDRLAGEPLLELTAPLPQAQLVETYLMGQLSHRPPSPPRRPGVCWPRRGARWWTSRCAAPTAPGPGCSRRG